MIHKNQHITMPEMAKQIGIIERAVEKNIKNLREHHLVERRDGEKSGFWRIIVLDFDK